MNRYEVLSEAIVLYVGYGSSKYPKVDKTRVTEVFGQASGDKLVRQVDAILDFMGSVDIDWGKYDLVSGSEFVISEVKKNYPDINVKAQAALAWIFSWWNK